MLQKLIIFYKINLKAFVEKMENSDIKELNQSKRKLLL
jgi:hypothetical protein